MRRLRSTRSRRRICRHKRRGTSGRISRLRISFIVAYKRRTRQIQAQLPLRLKKHARLGLAALTARVPIVRTMIQSLNLAADLLDIFLHPLVNRLQIGLRQSAAPNACLV